jgi:hypothetical protein
MSKTGSWLLAGIIAACGCSIGNAQISYANAFDGGAVTINAIAPGPANGLVRGSVKWLFPLCAGEQIM